MLGILAEVMKIPKATYCWALDHLVLEGDSDLFPSLFEVEAFNFGKDVLLKALSGLDVTTYHWKGGRRFVVPKDVFAFRTATQLEPLDSLILAALIKEYGSKIEDRRAATTDKVFSYRFSPDTKGSFYAKNSGWQQYWQNCLSKSSDPKCEWVAVTDISDYYNQIYHHVLENELTASAIPKPAVKAIMRLLSILSSGVSGTCQWNETLPVGRLL